MNEAGALLAVCAFAAFIALLCWFGNDDWPDGAA